MENAGLDWTGSPGPRRFVKARGTRSRTGRLHGPLRRIAGPKDACRSCGGGCEVRGLRCLTCRGTGIV